MSVRIPSISSGFIYLFLIFLFIGVPLLVYLTQSLKLHPGLAVAISFLLSMLLGTFMFSCLGGRRRT
ncbi:MAG: hypothetical protein QXW42_04175 [Thermofilum sp.]